MSNSTPNSMLHSTPPDTKPFLVGIGASAGGLEAYREVFAYMPAASGLAFVLVPHLSRHHRSHMVDLLRDYSEMEVLFAAEGVEIVADHVYIIPENALLSVRDGRLHLSPHPRTPGKNLVVDSFFQSLAVEYGEKAIGVILSGTMTDGAAGLTAIRERGGIDVGPESGNGSVC